MILKLYLQPMLHLELQINTFVWKYMSDIRRWLLHLIIHTEQFTVLKYLHVLSYSIFRLTLWLTTTIIILVWKIKYTNTHTHTHIHIEKDAF
jgi:hypothetical protein